MAIGGHAALTGISRYRSCLAANPPASATRRGYRRHSVIPSAGTMAWTIILPVLQRGNRSDAANHVYLIHQSRLLDVR